MYVLTSNETEQVSGAGSGLETLMGAVWATSHEAGVAGLGVGAAFFFGVAAGTALNWSFQRAFGDSVGGKLYDLLNKNPL